MNLPELIKHLTIIGLVLEVIHRIVVVIINAIRLLVSPEYRREVFGDDDPEGVPA